ncbi:hypothetical protein ACLI4U_13730 [Natrialbaceae archaeon A-CW2]|uniref:hypothetical protein n=1 Tax=Natronosalvus amylolyticus TaxID=2961994 RepID=UPI0020CA0B7E|nr:hypothetical protein [Natronosalvus amylolyticus]
MREYVEKGGESEFYQTKVTQALIDTGADFVMPERKNSSELAYRQHSVNKRDERSEREL